MTEWICAGLGAIITVATFAVVALDLPGARADIPDIRVTVKGIEPANEGFVVRIRARNVSDTTAAAFEIEGTLKRGSEIVETSHVTFDYVPRGSEENGGLWFRQDPRNLELLVRPTGYQEP
ncbi:MAG: TIGR02588 family protein [Rhizobiaceae bacterium]|nr:TIGR02588 family protein [Rhizobiaceae bacterium]